MALVAAPAALAKWLLRAAEWTAPIIVGLLDEDATADVPLVWRKLHVVYTRTTPTGTVEDKAIWTCDFLNLTSGNPDDTWDATDYTTMETALDAWHTALVSRIQNNHTLVEYRWYRRMYASLTAESVFADSGPPVRVTPRSVVGTGTIVMPYQVAAAVTKKTGLPGHWGRFYIPGINGSGMGSSGRLTSTAVSAFATETRTLFGAGVSRGIVPVVPLTQLDKSRAQGLLSVLAVQCDDIPDIQRRRRGKQAAIRTVITT